MIIELLLVFIFGFFMGLLVLDCSEKNERNKYLRQKQFEEEEPTRNFKIVKKVYKDDSIFYFIFREIYSYNVNDKENTLVKDWELIRPLVLGNYKVFSKDIKMAGDHKTGFTSDEAAKTYINSLLQEEEKEENSKTVVDQEEELISK
jgi:hypothetical protein